LASHRASGAILALVFLFLAALIGLRADSLHAERSAAIARNETAMRNLALVAEQYAHRVFETSALVSGQVAARVATLGGVEALRDDPGVHAWLRELSAASAGDALIVVDAHGTPVATSDVFPAPQVDLSDRRWFQFHAQGGDVLVGSAVLSRLTHEIIFTFSRILRRPDGGFDGAVRVAVHAGFFDQPLSDDIAGSAVIGLFDQEGRVMALTGLTPAQFDTSLKDSPVYRASMADHVGTLHAKSPFDGRERIVAYRRLNDWPVLVSASVPVDAALAPWHRSVRWSIELIGSVAAGLLLLAVVATRIANREERMRSALAVANAALRDSATGLEERVAARTRELMASRRRFRVIFDSTFQLLTLLDAKGVVLEANETALAFLGLQRGDVVGRRLSALPCWPEEKVRKDVAQAVAAAARGTARRAEIMARSANGRLAPLEVALRPVRGADGRIAWLVAEGHDLTELKAAEAQLRESQKMEALGQLTGGVAHDFNNLLMVVLGNLGLLRKRLPPDPRLARLLDGAQQGAERGAALTQRMLAFGRRQELRPEPVDLRDLVTGLTSLLERSAGPTIRVEKDLPAGLPPAMVDANQLELALLNLTVNARDAMPGGGAIRIRVSAAEAPSGAAPRGLLPGRYLALSFTDEGAGMDAATLTRATEPFFTTKGVGHGSGLGLSMVQGLAQQSGGGLRLSSKLGRGTTAEIWLPQAEARITARSDPPAPPKDADAAPPRRVLVVDDDPLVAAGTMMMLEDLGHDPVLAASGEEALARVGSDAALELVLTDHAMPGMTGLELAEQLRRERPGLPVVLATGYAEVPAGAGTWLPRLNKPYRQDELGALVRRLTRAAAA
jgi:PAS domain S-box-containing protein